PELHLPAQGTGLLKAVTGLLGNLGGRPLVEAAPTPRAHAEPDQSHAQETATGRDPEQVLQSLVAPGISIELSPLLSQHAAVGGEHSQLHDVIAHARYRLAHDMGFVFPLVHLRENHDQAEDRYAIRLMGETVAEGRLVPDMRAAVGGTFPIEWPVEPHPVRHVSMSWVNEAAARTFAGELQAPHTLLADHLEDVIRRNAHRIFNNQSLDMLLRTFEYEIGKDTLSELFGRFMSLTELRLVLQTMLKAGYSIKNLPKIVDILMSHFINYLAEKPLGMDETWKISSHIPFFSTEELTRIVCEGLGLPMASDRRSSMAAALERTIRQSPATYSPPMDPADLDRPERLPLDSEKGAI
ncbi:MAG: flhA, partial [Cyanobacteria bacterium RYN_339]|nr:flhA [Cyanobacteria bacterium RYN_339]